MKRKEVLTENPLAIALMGALVGMGLEKEKAKKAAAQAVNQAQNAPAGQQAAPAAPQGADYNQIMKRGSRGEGVKQLQRNLGMTGSEVDGIFGPATEKAVRTFQKNSGAKVDGIVGPETRGMIEKYANSPDKDPSKVKVDAPTKKSAGMVRNKKWKKVPAPQGFTPPPEDYPNPMYISDGKVTLVVKPEPVGGSYVGEGPIQNVPGVGMSLVRTGRAIPVGDVDVGGAKGPKVGDPITPEYQKILQQKTGDGGMVGEPMTQADVAAIMGESVMTDKKQLDEASININGADASEVAEILRMMQLAGADGAKVVGPDDINPGPKPCPICGKIHGPSQPMGGCGAKPKEPEMGDMIRMMSPGEAMEEEEVDGDFQDASTEPDEEYANDVSASIPSGNDLHKEKGSYPATAGGDNPMNTEDEDLEEQIKTQLRAALNARK